jgi:hypothetical protein
LAWLALALVVLALLKLIVALLARVVRAVALAGLRAAVLRAALARGLEVVGAVGILGAISYFLLAGCEVRVLGLSVRLYPFAERGEHLFVTRCRKIVTA